MVGLLPGASAKTGKMGLFMPITTGGVQLMEDPFLSFTCAASLAVHHVNTRDESIVHGLGELVQNFTLEATVFDTGFTESVAIESYRKFYAAGNNVLVGAVRSAVSAPLALFGQIDRIPQARPSPTGAQPDRACR